MKLQIDVEIEPYADALELDKAALQLGRELRELDDVQSVERPSAGPPPPGTRAVEAAVLGTLVVTTTREVIAAVVHAVASWLGRRPGRTLKLTMEGDSIEVTDPSKEEERQLVQAFLARHAQTS